MSQLSVDTAHHVITDIKAYHADKRDSQYLQDISKRLKNRLHKQGLLWRNCIADTGYSSGDNYAFLEKEGLESYIPPHGTYKGGPEGFTYNEEHDHWVCSQNKIIPFTKIFYEGENNNKKKEYRASKYLCLDCPIRSSCLKKSQEKRITITYYTKEYQRNIARVDSMKGRYMKGKRQSTVEPVFGTLTQFMGLRKINTIGIQQANKVMHLSAMAYNLKKYLKFITKTVKSDAKAMHLFVLEIKALFTPQISGLETFNY
tara:strand:- start:121 stop:894 length:774 start_codon:yes stop_codon:yes gene_type:complete